LRRGCGICTRWCTSPQEKKRTTPLDSVELVACAPLLLHARGGAQEACRVGVQRRRETHRRGDQVAVSRRDTPARVFLGFRGLIFFARKGIVVVAQNRRQGAFLTYFSFHFFDGEASTWMFRHDVCLDTRAYFPPIFNNFQQ
jgi:hypothetical protein